MGVDRFWDAQSAHKVPYEQILIIDGSGYLLYQCAEVGNDNVLEAARSWIVRTRFVAIMPNDYDALIGWCDKHGIHLIGQTIMGRPQSAKQYTRGYAEEEGGA